MEKTNYTFEILCVEPEDIKNEKSLSKALSFSDSLWKGKEPVESKETYLKLTQCNLGIVITIMPLDTSNILTDYIETAFILKISSTSFDELEEFRLRILKHLKAKLSFQQIRVLRDDVSTFIANQLYPKINKVENSLRRYLSKFFLQRVGIDWWEVSANIKMLDKVKMRKKDRKDEFTNYIDTDIEYADFDDLGTLIYKQSTGFNQPEKALEQVLNIDTLEKLNIFKDELQGNYVKYFKENFRDKNFEKLWIELFKIRNKVAHQGTFYKDELIRGEQLYEELIELIKNAEEKIDELVLSVEEKEAFRNASIDALTEEEPQKVLENVQQINEIPGVKIVGKLDLLAFNRTFKGHAVLTEESLFEHLEEAKHVGGNQFVGLKWFVTQYLAEKNFSIGFSYSLINILADKGEIELYDVPAYGGYDIKAIRKIEKNES